MPITSQNFRVNINNKQPHSKVIISSQMYHVYALQHSMLYVSVLTVNISVTSSIPEHHVLRRLHAAAELLHPAVFAVP